VNKRGGEWGEAAEATARKSLIPKGERKICELKEKRGFKRSVGGEILYLGQGGEKEVKFWTGEIREKGKNWGGRGTASLRAMEAGERGRRNSSKDNRKSSPQQE